MSKFSVRKPLTVFVAVLAVIILGVVAFTRMTPDLFPNMDFPYVMIMTTYPGQSPEIVEEEITRPLEQSMATLEHIKQITSSSRENYSLLVMEFDNDVNMDTIGVDIQQNISALQGGWDDTVGAPYVLKINPSVIPIEIVSVSREGMDITELSDFLDETVVPKLEGVTGVASVSASGSVYRQMNVVLSQEKIDAVNARLADKVNAKLDDTQSELEDTKKDLEDAKSELEKAQKELDDGKQSLLGQSSSAQSQLSSKQAELLEGKLQLQQQLVSLQQTKTTIEEGLASLRQAKDGYTQLESAIAQLNDGIAQLDALPETLAQAQAQETVLQSQIAELQTQIDTLPGQIAVLEGQIASLEEQIAALEALGDEAGEDTAAQLVQLQAALAEAQAGLAAAQEGLTAAQAGQAEAQAGLAALQGQIVSLQTAVETAPAQREALQAQLVQAQAGLETMDAELAAQGMDRESLDGQIAELEGNLAQVNDGISQMNATMTQLENGSIQLSDAMGALSSGQSAGLLQLADAAAQLTINSATVQSALDEVESGLQQLADSREDALSQADMSGAITMETVAQILGAQDFSMPAGYIQEDGVSYMVSVGDPIEDEEELRGLLLFDTGEDGIGPIYLEDVAEVFVTDNADSVYAKLNGADSVMLTFDKQSNAATAEVSDNLKAKFDELEADYPGLEFASMMDQGDYIYLIINSILQSLLTGALFAIIVLFLFLRDLRPTIITLVAIPVSVIFAFVLMYFSGVTLNMISMSGLAVAVGMLVDNSIVVIENIYRLRAKGATAVQAAVAGARQVAGAVTSSTLTTVCVFLPIVFVEGITKQLFTDLALTMSYSLMASLIIALTLVPAMAKGMLKDRKHKKPKPQKRESFIYRAYRRLAAWNLRHKWVALGLAIALLAVTAKLALDKGFSFIPEIDMNMVNITVAMPEDATREEAVELADQTLERLSQIPDAEYVGAMMGGSSVSALAGGGGSSYDLSVYIGLPEGYSGAAAGKQAVELCEDLPCEVRYDSAMMDMSLLTGSGITVNLYGTDMEQLQSAAGILADTLAGVEGVEEVDDGLEQAETAYHVAVDKNKAMAKGLTVAQIYMDLASALTSSATALDMELGSVTADVVVQAPSGMTMEDLENYVFETTNQQTGETTSFRLDEVAEIEPTVSLSTIGRIDQRRYLAVTASLQEGYNVTLVTDRAMEAVEAAQLPEGITYEFTGENETIMEAVEDLMLMLAIGVVLVYFIMVAQFQSLKSPFIVMFTIPLAFTGGFAALLLFDMDVSIVSIIGFVMLVGIIVNNGIVLVDYVNQLRAGGMERRAALVEAGVTRMRPIFMTSLTTILGLIVMALGKNVGTSIMQPIAVVCIGGLLYATLMTLFVVPCIYDIMNKKELAVLTEEDMEFNEQ